MRDTRGRGGARGVEQRHERVEGVDEEERQEADKGGVFVKGAIDPSIYIYWGKA